MLKKLQNLLFEDDDEFVEDNTEAEQVAASAPVTPAVQPEKSSLQQTAKIPVQTSKHLRFQQYLHYQLTGNSCWTRTCKIILQYF